LTGQIVANVIAAVVAHLHKLTEILRVAVMTPLCYAMAWAPAAATP
jgi:hypothetical protein